MLRLMRSKLALMPKAQPVKPMRVRSGSLRKRPRSDLAKVAAMCYPMIPRTVMKMKRYAKAANHNIRLKTRVNRMKTKVKKRLTIRKQMFNLWTIKRDRKHLQDLP